MKNCTAYLLPLAASLSLLLAACTTPPTPTPPTVQTDPAHAPQILRIADREDVQNGYLIIYKDIFFTDPDGDADSATYSVVSSSLPYSLNLQDALIEIPTETQKSEALFNEIASCWQKLELRYEVRLRDRAGNLSEPVLVTLSCPAPQPLDIRPLLVSGLSTAFALGAVVSLGFWLLFRKRPTERLKALRSMALMVSLVISVGFMWSVLHEGGHALYLLVRGVPATLYIHPFAFSAFSRPLIIGSGIWKDILGSAIALPVSLLISSFFWKCRSIAAFLPLAMLFPYSALGDGFNVMGIMGDFWNLVQLTGLPAPLFWILGALILCIGMILFFSLLPLAGLDPRDNNALFVLPAAMWLIGIFSLLVAYTVVPGSPINLEFFLGREILLSANRFLFVYFGVILAVLYVTVFRKFYHRLPGWLQAETTELSWKDLRMPAVLALTCVILGLIIIT